MVTISEGPFVELADQGGGLQASQDKRRNGLSPGVADDLPPEGTEHVAGTTSARDVFAAAHKAVTAGPPVAPEQKPLCSIRSSLE